MFKKLHVSTGNLLAISIKGKAEVADYEQIGPEVDKILAQYHKIRFLIEVKDFKGITAKAIIKEICIDLKVARKTDKVATVGAKGYQEWLSNLISPLFFKTKMRFFPHEEFNEALAWVTKDMPPPKDVAATPDNKDHHNK